MRLLGRWRIFTLKRGVILERDWVDDWLENVREREELC
jgi:hypothetical protein